jgi:hypothetical protein
MIQITSPPNGAPVPPGVALTIAGTLSDDPGPIVVTRTIMDPAPGDTVAETTVIDSPGAAWFANVTIPARDGVSIHLRAQTVLACDAIRVQTPPAAVPMKEKDGKGRR